MKKRFWITERIKELNKKKKDLAEVLGLPHTRISDMISGTRALKITEIVAFADYMEMSVDDVLSRFGASNTNNAPRYDGLGNDEREVVELYRGLSEPGKQKFQALAEVVKKDEDVTPSNSN